MIDYDFDTLAGHFKEVAYLNKALEINFRCEWSLEKRQGDIERTYFFDSGIASMVKNVNRNRKAIQELPCHFEKTVDETSVEFAIQYNDGFAESVLSFANCINTQEGGSHVTGFRSALTRVINDYARKQGFLKEAEANLAGEDVREGLAAVISVRLKDPQFEGQTRQARQRRDQDRRGVRGGEGLTRYLEDNQAEAKKIIDKCLTSRKAGRLPGGPGRWSSGRTPWTAPPCRASWPTAANGTRPGPSSTSSRESRRAAPPRWAGTGPSRPSCRSRARS